MIEKYFKAGVMFNWTKPSDVIGARDGEFVDSMRPTAPMIYMGLEPGKGGKLIDPFLKQFNVNTLGLSMRLPIQYAWLDYTHAQTSRLPIGPYDVLTGFMSGCIVAYWTTRGVRYAGHVGTIESDPALNRIVKRKFAFAMARDTIGFNPMSAWDFAEIMPLMNLLEPRAMNAKIIALVTTHGEFYSILMLQQTANQWCSGGIKKVPPIRHDELKLLMLRD